MKLIRVCLLVLLAASELLMVATPARAQRDRTATDAATKGSFILVAHGGAGSYAMSDKEINSSGA